MMRGPSENRVRVDSGAFVTPPDVAAQLGKDMAALGAVILFGIAVVLWTGWGW